MRSKSAQMARTSIPSEKQKVTLLQQVLLQNTNINSTLIRLMWASSISGSKRRMAMGKVSYSAILVIDSKGDSGKDELISFRTWPNPATNNLVFQFNSNQTGRFLLELVSTSGQVVQEKAVTLTGTSQIRMDLSSAPVRGLYFLRTTDLSHSRKYVSKVFIE